MNTNDFFIKVVPDPSNVNEKGGVMTHLDYGLWYRNILEKDGTICSFVPILNLYFYSHSRQEVAPMAKIVMEAYIDEHLMEDAGGLYSFARHLKTLGFEPSNSVLDWNKLRKRQIFQSILFKPYKSTMFIPEDFGGGEEVEDVKVTEKFEFAY